MKRGTPDHPKTKRLAELLKLARWEVVGLLESLWHFAANYSKRGDIGRWSNADIASGLEWSRTSPEELIQALVDCHFLDECAEHRLLVHDWPDHADQTVERSNEVKKLGFARKNYPAISHSQSHKPEPKPCSMSAVAEGVATEPPSESSGEAAEPPGDPFASEFLASWNVTAGNRKARVMTGKRMKHFRARAREPTWRENWRAALAKFPLRCFDDPTGWQPDLDWFLKPDTVANILEGKYDWSKSNGKSTARAGGSAQRYRGD